MKRSAKGIDEKSLRNWKVHEVFRGLLADAASRREPGVSKRAGGPERKLLESDYLSLFLFGLLNPVAQSMRGLCAASHLTRVQRDVCSRLVRLGSFSEAQSVFREELLRAVFLELVKKTQVQSQGDERLKPLAVKLVAVDGTLLPALPRMFGKIASQV